MPLTKGESKNLGKFIQDKFGGELIRDELFSDGTCEVRIINFPVNIPRFEIEEKISDFYKTIGFKRMNEYQEFIVYKEPRTPASIRIVTLSLLNHSVYISTGP